MYKYRQILCHNQAITFFKYNCQSQILHINQNVPNKEEQKKNKKPSLGYQAVQKSK